VFSAANYSPSAPQNVTTLKGNFTATPTVISSTAINVTLGDSGDGIPSAVASNISGVTFTNFGGGNYQFSGLSPNTEYSIILFASGYNDATTGSATTNKTFTAAQTGASLTSATITLTAVAGALPGVVTVVRNGITTDNVGVHPPTGSVDLQNITGTHDAVISAFGYDSVTVPNVYVKQRLTKPTPTVSAGALGELIVSGYADSNAAHYDIIVQYESGIQAANTGANGTTLTSYTFSNLQYGTMYRVTVMSRTTSSVLYTDSENSEFVYKRTSRPFNISVSSSTSTSITYSLNGSIPSSPINFIGLTGAATVSYTAGANTFTINGLSPGSSSTITLSATDFITADTPPATTKSANTNATIKINNITAAGSPLTVTVPNGTTVIDVAAELENSNAIVHSGNNTGIVFFDGIVCYIVVQAEDRAVTQTYVVTVNEAPPAASSDNTLSSAGISCNGVLLVDGQTTVIPFSATGYTVAATPNNAGAIISGTGSKSLVFGTNTISVTVTQNGSPATYTRTVNVISSGNSADTSLATFTIGGVDMKGLTSYEFPYNTPDTIPVIVTLANNATFGTAPSSSVAFPVGAGLAANIIFTVVSQDGSALTSYNISVTRAPPSNDTSATIIINGFERADNSHINVANGTTSVTIDVSIATGATSTIIGNSNMQTGENKLYVDVTAQDGSTSKRYTFTVNVAAKAMSLVADSATSSSISFTLSASPLPATPLITINRHSDLASFVYDPDTGAITISNLPAGLEYMVNVSSPGYTSASGFNTTTSPPPAQLSSDKSLSVFKIGTTDVANDGMITLPAGTTSVSVTATPTATSATAVLNGTINMSIPRDQAIQKVVQTGANMITVLVTAEDGTTQPYTVTVNVLESISLTFFSATQTSLTFTVSPYPLSSTTNFNITPLASSIQYINGKVTFAGLTADTPYTAQVQASGHGAASASGRTLAAAPAPAPGPTPICFLADAPVLTPSGYRAISTIKMGDKVLTADGRLVTVRSTYAKRYLASAATNPYVIPKGTLGAMESLPISPNHEVLVPGKGMIKAKHLGLRQMTMKKSFMYYNLELDDWVCDNMTVAGVEVESLAPTKRITMTREEYADFVYNRYGTPTADTLARIKQVFYRLEDGRVSAPVFASK